MVLEKVDKADGPDGSIEQDVRAGKRPMVDGPEQQGSGKLPRPQRSIEQQIEELESDIEDVQHKIENAEQKVESTQGELQKYWIEKEKLLREEKKQLREEKKQLREKEKLYPSPPDRVEHLLHLFGEQLRFARQPVSELSPMRNSGRLPLNRNGYLETQLGSYFALEGRQHALRMQIKGAAQIFDTFMSPTEGKPKDVLRRSIALLMIVGFPGAGKTSLGVETTALLHHFWEHNQAEVDELLRSVLREDLVAEFRSMVENSKSYHCRIFREIEAASDGLTLHEETGLGPSQLLALNALYGCLDCSGRAGNSPRGDFVSSYVDMLRRLPAVKETLTFEDVVAFIRSGLNLSNRILLSFFFDEANKSMPSPGRSVSWFQEMMASFVDWFHEHHGKETFVVITAATTRFANATLQGTASGLTQSSFIPVPPLATEESEQVVFKFLNRLHKTLNGEGSVELSDDVKQVISLSAGNPRMLSYLLRAFCTSSPNVDINPHDLYRELCRASISKEAMEAIILRAWKQIASSYYAKYMDPLKRRLVLRALQASLLGETVYRSYKVLAGFEDTWGELEGMGLVGLRNDSSLSLPSAQNSDSIPARVAFSTMILRHIFSLSTDTLSTLLPPLESSDWKVKEKADLYTLMFLILLHHETTGRSTFKLADVLPRGWFIPSQLGQLEFHVPSGSWEVKQANQLKTPKAFWAFMSENSSHWAFIGPHNFGADSWLRLVCTRTQQVMMVVLESKCCGLPATLPVVKYMGEDSIVEKAEKDLRPMMCARVGGASQESPATTLAEQVSRDGFGMEQVVFLYMSDQNVQSALEQHKSKCAGMTGVASRLIIAGEHPSDSPLCKMSAIRHMMVYTPRDNLLL